MMAVAGYLMGFLDFESSLTIDQVAEQMSVHVFGGIAFVEKDVDEDNEFGTLCLTHDFLGLQVDLFGKNGTFTIEIATRPSASVSDISEVCDLSAILSHNVGKLSEFKIA